MSRRVFLGPGTLRVGYPGYDAAVAGFEGLIFSADMVSFAGSISGELNFEASPTGGPQNTYQPVTRVVPLPAGSGIPIVWIWNARQDLPRTGFTNGSMLIFFDAGQQNLICEQRSQFGSHIGYLLYRNRS